MMFGEKVRKSILIEPGGVDDTDSPGESIRATDRVVEKASLETDFPWPIRHQDAGLQGEPGR